MGIISFSIPKLLWWSIMSPNCSLLSKDCSVRPLTMKDVIEKLKETRQGRIATIVNELMDEYETQMIINQFKGEEHKRGRKVLNEIKEKYLRKVQEIISFTCDDELFRSINRSINRGLKDSEKFNDWNMLQSKTCVNKAVPYIDS